MIGKELVVGLANGLVFAVLVEILIPLTLDRCDVDPAIASGVFPTTVTDVVGFSPSSLASVFLF